MKKKFNMAKILVLFILVVGTLTVVFAACKVISTSGKLLVLNDNIQFYNEQTRKTDAMTKDVEHYFKERQKIYDSDDIVIHFFANQNTLAKMIILIIAVASFPALFYMWAFVIATQIGKARRRAYKQRRRNSN